MFLNSVWDEVISQVPMCCVDSMTSLGLLIHCKDGGIRRQKTQAFWVSPLTILSYIYTYVCIYVIGNCVCQPGSSHSIDTKSFYYNQS